MIYLYRYSFKEMDLAKYSSLLQTYLHEKAAIKIYKGTISVTIEVELADGNYLFGLIDEKVDWTSYPGHGRNKKVLKAIKDWLHAIKTEPTQIRLCAEFVNRIRRELIEKTCSFNQNQNQNHTH